MSLKTSKCTSISINFVNYTLPCEIFSTSLKFFPESLENFFALFLDRVVSFADALDPL